MDEGNIAPIELDLMRSYIRQLYETFLDSDSPQMTTPPPSRPQKEPDFEVARKPKEEYQHRPPRIIEIPDSFKAEETKDDPTPQPQSRPVQPPKPDPQQYRPPQPRPKPDPAPKPQLRQEEPEENMNSKHEVLFEKQTAKELSEKLSQQPIQDLTKAIALNDKLLYANELFDKELSDFNKAIYRINGMRSFDEAKIYISELASKYEWTKDEERLEQAKDLSKLVRRRFL